MYPVALLTMLLCSEVVETLPQERLRTMTDTFEVWSDDRL